jgi:hypothetical protein
MVMGIFFWCIVCDQLCLAHRATPLQPFTREMIDCSSVLQVLAVGTVRTKEYCTLVCDPKFSWVSPAS